MGGGNRSEVQNARAVPMPVDSLKDAHAVIPFQWGEPYREYERFPARFRQAEAPPVAIFQQPVRQLLAGACLDERRSDVRVSVSKLLAP